MIAEYASAEPAALAAIPPRIDNVKILVTLLRCAVPRQGALWLAEEVVKLVPLPKFHLEGSVYTPGLQCHQNPRPSLPKSAPACSASTCSYSCGAHHTVMCDRCLRRTCIVNVLFYKPHGHQS
jgi:hypothetical protein